MNLYRRFWRAVALFAYRRWTIEGQPKPVGVPGNRDPDHPCDIYSPRPLRIGDFADCQGDGHYLCQECCHLDRSPFPDGEQSQDEIRKFLRGIGGRA
jgi:hypothetical protein